MGEIIYNGDKKFDMQLSQSLIYERRLGEIFRTADIEKIELKSESYLWEDTGNIAIEYSYNGKPSGIAATQATMWVHELVRNDGTLMYLMWPIDRLKELCRQAFVRKMIKENCGDDGLSCVVKLPLKWTIDPKMYSGDRDE